MNPFLVFLPVFFLPASLCSAHILLGSPEARALENTKANQLGLERVADEHSMKRLIQERRLVRVPNNEYVRWHRHFPREYAFSLPHTHMFLVQLGREFRKTFHKPITVTSAIRPISYQRRLALRNPNAAPAEGTLASTHPTGATIDLGYKNLLPRERMWLESYLSKKEREGKIQATQERYQACFHIMVYPTEHTLAITNTNLSPL